MGRLEDLLLQKKIDALGHKEIDIFQDQSQKTLDRVIKEHTQNVTNEVTKSVSEEELQNQNNKNKAIMTTIADGNLQPPDPTATHPLKDSVVAQNLANLSTVIHNWWEVDEGGFWKRNQGLLDNPWGLPNAYMSQEDMLNPSWLQSFLAGLIPGHPHEGFYDIEDLDVRLAHGEKAGIPEWQTRMDTALYGFGELLQFITVYRIAGRSMTTLMPALQYLNVIKKGKDLGLLTERMTSFSKKAQQARFFPDALAKDIANLTGSQQAFAHNVGRVGIESTIWKQLHGDWVEALMWAAGYPAAFKYGLFPGIKGAWNATKGGLKNVKITTDRDGQWIQPVPKGQDKDTIKLIPELQNIKSALELETANIASGRGPSGVIEENLAKELSKITTNPKVSNLINDIQTTTIQLEKKAGSLLDMYTKKKVGILHVEDTIGPRFAEIRNDVLSGKFDFTALPNYLNQVDELGQLVATNQKRLQKELFSSLLNDMDDVLAKFVPSEYTSVNSANLLSWDAKTLKQFGNMYITTIENLIYSTRKNNREAEIIKQIFQFGSGKEPAAVFKQFRRQMDKKILQATSGVQQPTLKGWLQSVKVNPALSRKDNIEQVSKVVQSWDGVVNYAKPYKAAQEVHEKLGNLINKVKQIDDKEQKVEAIKDVIGFVLRTVDSNTEMIGKPIRGTYFRMGTETGVIKDLAKYLTHTLRLPKSKNLNKLLKAKISDASQDVKRVRRGGLYEGTDTIGNVVERWGTSGKYWTRRKGPFVPFGVYGTNRQYFSAFSWVERYYKLLGKELEGALSPEQVAKNIAGKLVPKELKGASGKEKKIPAIVTKLQEVRKKKRLSGDEIQDLVDNLITQTIQRGRMAIHGIHPGDIGPKAMGKLESKIKRLRKLDNDLDNQLVKRLGKQYKVKLGEKDTATIGDMFNHLERQLTKLAHELPNSATVSSHVRLFDRVRELTRGIKLLGEYRTAVAGREKYSGVEALNQRIGGLEKIANRLGARGRRVNMTISNEYQKRMKDHMDNLEHKVPELVAIEKVIADFMTSTRLSAESMGTARNQLYKVITEYVYRDLDGVIQSAKLKNIPLDRMLKDAGVAVGRENTKQDRIRTAYAVTRAMFADDAVRQAIVLPNTELSNLMVLFKATQDPSYRSLVKTIFLRNRTATKMLDTLTRLANLEGPIATSLNKAVTEITEEGTKKAASGPGLEALRQKGRDVLGEGSEWKDVSIFGTPGQELKSVPQAVNWLFNELPHLAERTGTDFVPALVTKISDSTQRLVRMMSKGSVMDKDVRYLENEMKILIEKYPQYDKNQISHVLDKLDEISMKIWPEGAKFTPEIERALSQQADEFLSRFPEINKYVNDYYDILWKHAEIYNKEVDKVIAMVDEGLVFKDIGTKIPFLTGKEAYGFQKIARRKYYRPRFGKKTQLETYEVHLNLSKEVGGEAQTHRILVGTNLKSLEKVHEVLGKHATKYKMDKGWTEGTYTIHVNQPMLGHTVGHADSALSKLVADMENIMSHDLSTLQKALKSSEGWNYDKFYSTTFQKGPSMAYTRTGKLREYEVDHMVAAKLYLARIARHTALLEPATQAHALNAWLASPAGKQIMVNKAGEPMTGTIQLIKVLTDDMLGRPDWSAKAANKVWNGTTQFVNKHIPYDIPHMDVRTFIDTSNSLSYLMQFGLDLQKAGLQTTLYVTSVLPHAGKYAYMGLFGRGSFGTNLMKLHSRWSLNKQYTGDNKWLQGYFKSATNKFNKLPKSKRNAIEDIDDVYTSLNLGVDSSHALYITEQFLKEGGASSAERTILGKLLHNTTNAATILFRKGDIIPRKLAANIAYETADDVATATIHKLNVAGFDYKAGSLTYQKVMAVARAKNVTFNPLEEEAMKLIVNSGNRHFLKAGRKGFIRKHTTKDRSGYMTHRDFKKDLALRFSEKTNHLYNSTNNSQFLNLSLLKQYNLYKKFSLKEFHRLAGTVRKGQHGATMGTMLMYTVLGGYLGMPMARTGLRLYEFLFGLVNTAAGNPPDLASQDVETSIRNKVYNPIRDDDDPTHALSHEEGIKDKLLGMAALGIASPLGIDWSQQASWNIDTYFAPRGRFDTSLDKVGNVLLGDNYRRMYNTSNRLADWIQWRSMRDTGDGVAEKALRFMEVFQEFATSGGKNIIKALQLAVGQKPLESPRGGGLSSGLVAALGGNTGDLAPADQTNAYKDVPAGVSAQALLTSMGFRNRKAENIKFNTRSFAHVQAAEKNYKLYQLTKAWHLLYDTETGKFRDPATMDRDEVEELGIQLGEIIGIVGDYDVDSFKRKLINFQQKMLLTKEAKILMKKDPAAKKIIRQRLMIYLNAAGLLEGIDDKPKDKTLRQELLDTPKY